MSNKVIATRYAQAIFSEAVATNVELQVELDFSTIAETLLASHDLRRLFRSPLIDSHRKKKVAIEVFKDKVSAVTMQFLELVLNKGREGLMIDIIRSFEELMDKKRNILRVDVTSAKPLDEASKSQLDASLAKMTGKEIRATYQENAAMLGGISVRIGDKVYDGSLRHQLAMLKEKLASA